MKVLKIERLRTSRSMSLPRHPFLEGVASLGRLGGDNSLFNDYLMGDNLSDLRRDWQTIGSDMRKVFHSLNKGIYAR